MTIKRAATLLLFILSVAGLGGCSSPEKDKEVLLSKAMKYIEKNEKDAAILELRNAIKIDAKYSEALYQLGLLYLEKGDARNAFAQLVRAADIDPTNLDANLKVAQLNLLARQKAESRQRIDQILSKEPQHRDTLALLANLELIEGNYDLATLALEKIGKETENSDQLLNIKGRIFAAKEEWDEAEKAFQQAIEVNNKNIANHQVLLRLYEQKQEKEKAKSLLDDMILLFPENPQPHLLLAGYYNSIGKKELVEPSLRKVIELAPDNARARLQLANHLRQKATKKDAQDVLLKAHQDFPDNTDIISTLASHYFESGDYQQAKDLLTTLEAKENGHGGAKLLNARFLLKEGKVRDGITMLQDLNRDFPQWAEPFFHLGLAHYSLREIDLAEQAVTVALDKNKNEAKYHVLMAQIHQGKGRFKEAQKEAATALHLNPRNLRSAIILSRALIGDKEYEKAVEILKNMRIQVPTSVEVLESLAIGALGSKDLELGEDALVSLLDIDPAHNRGLALYMGLKYSSDLPGAETFILKQLEKAPNDFKLFLVLGGLQDKQGKVEAALESFEQAQTLAPETPRPYLAAANLLTKIGKQDEAIKKYQSMLEKYPKSIQGHMGIAALYETKGEAAKAMKHYEKTLEAKEDFAPAANNLAWLIASAPDGDLGRALQLAMIAKQAHPEDPHIADTLGWVHFHRKSYPLALTQFAQALEQSPNNRTIAYHLAMAQVGNNSIDDAVQTLTTLLAHGDDFTEREQAKNLLADLTGNE